MVLSPKLMRALSEYWYQKFKSEPEVKVNADLLLAVPDESTLCDKESMFTIIHNVRNELYQLGTDEKQLQQYAYYGFAPIAYFFSKIPSNRFSAIEMDELVREVGFCCERGAINKRPYQCIRKASKLIHSYYVKGSLDKRDATKLKGYRTVLSDEFENLVELYVDKIGEYRCLSVNTLPTRRGLIRSFLAQLEQQGVDTVAGITRPAISESITQNARKYSPGSKDWVHYSQQFLWFLHEEGITLEDFSTAIPDTLPRKRVIRGGFSEEEIFQILSAVDKNALNGKRDYAFMAIAARTGLRGMDIVNLKLDSIDWRSNEMRIVQHKTGNALILPLVQEVGNAVADYILNSRPESNSGYIFVKRCDPAQPFSRQCATAVVKKHMALAGVDCEKTPHRGIHSFRRGLGKALLEASVPIDMINELLGHADMNSSRPYLAIDENGLRNCALGLIPLEMEGGPDAV